ncbi:outer membrane beta-barrel protein [Ancylobacter sp. IITR112]|uniref:outer membrane beta-barrel protein n=1 Tax=Ancylobacter sp. IITR112 TaxID=3138073 RepID=UPI00352A2BA0
MMRFPHTGLVLGMMTLFASHAVRADDVAPSYRPAVEVDPARAAVLDRQPVNYLPLGVPIGSFVLFPTLKLETGYDTNITAANSNEKESWLFTVRPAFDLQSDWTRHFLAVDGYFESTSYARYSNADYENYAAGARGRIDVTSDFTIGGYARYAHLNELPGDDETNVNNLGDPLPYEQVTAGASFDKQFNRLWTTGGFDFRYRDYDDWLNGAPSDQSYRDGSDYKFAGRVGYELSPLTSVFVGGSYHWFDMQDSDYNAYEYKVITGLKIEPSRLTRGEAFIGYYDWTSDSGYLSGSSGLTFGANLQWFLSPLLTATFTAGQQVITSNYEFAGFTGSAVVSSTASVRLDYEFRRNIVISGWIDYLNQDYDEFPRVDNQYEIGAELRYSINRFATAKINYSYTDFDTNFNNINGAENYIRNLVLAGVTFAY